MVVAACSPAAETVKEPEPDRTPSPPPSTTTTGASDAGSSERAAATFRVAHLAAGIGPIDFCYRAPGTEAYEGPVLGTWTESRDAGKSWIRDASSADAQDDADDADAPSDAAPIEDAASIDPSALAPLEVTSYLSSRASGTFVFAIVAAGSPSCKAPLLEGSVTLDAGKRATILVVAGAWLDAAASPDGIIALTDDAMVDPSGARLRLVHAAPGVPALRASLAFAGAPIALADAIEPGHAATESLASPRVDALGYHVEPPIASLVSLHLEPKAGGDAWMSAPADLGLRTATNHTGFIVGDGASPRAIVWCDDTEVTGKKTRCAIVD
jgi:hypothetical protein